MTARARTGSTAPGGRRLTVLALVSAVALSGCVPATEASPGSALLAPRGELVLAFDDGLLEEGKKLRRVQSSGSALMRLTVARKARGALRRGPGRYGYAASTPGFRQGKRPPLAAVVVRPRGDDRLSPGTRPFRWGADIKIDPGAIGKPDGSNVVQRGLYEDPVQFKLQVDDAVPSCRVRGALDAVKLAGTDRLEPGEWYRLHCQLRDGRLTLRVGRPGRPGTSVHSAAAEVGALDFARSTPVAVAAKLRRDGEIVAASAEQFHGLLDNVFVDIG